MYLAFITKREKRDKMRQATITLFVKVSFITRQETGFQSINASYNYSICVLTIITLSLFPLNIPTLCNNDGKIKLPILLLQH